MVMMLTHSGGQDEDSPNRVVTLDCRGRGGYANHVWRFDSASPLDYRPAAGTPTPKKPKQKSTLKTKILQGRALTAICNDGDAYVCQKKGKASIYKLKHIPDQQTTKK